MPINYMQHRTNQYRQDVCYTKKLMAECRRKKLADKFISINNVSCKCPSTERVCSWYKGKYDCRSDYEYYHYKSLGKEVPIKEITFANRKLVKTYHCPCPPDPCASEAFYNQCREHEAKNMHSMDFAEAELMLSPKNYPREYPATAMLIGQPEIKCYCPPAVVSGSIAPYSFSVA